MDLAQLFSYQYKRASYISKDSGKARTLGTVKYSRKEKFL